MKINIHIFYSLILFSLIVFCCVEYHNNNVLESRINSLNKNSIDFNSEKTFKEDYYITQQSSDTNLILVVFAVLITFSGVFTYVNILERWNAKMAEINAERDKQNNKYNDFEHNLMVLKSELNFQIGLIYSERGTYIIKHNFNAGLMMCFCAMEKFAIIYSDDNYESKKQESIKLISQELVFLNKLIDDNHTFNIEIDYRIYKDRIDRIIKTLDSKNLEMFNRIISKIKIIEQT